MIRVGINGFGRIGRMVTREILKSGDMQLVAINELGALETMAHLFRFDSVHGKFTDEVRTEDGSMVVRGERIKYHSERSPSAIPWSDSKVDVVLECTGHFKTYDQASEHLGDTVKHVIVTAATSDSKIPMVVLGINEEVLNGSTAVISNASCTTNNAAPMIKLLHEHFRIESCYITTVHSYTGDQRLQDSPHNDLRRARAAALSIVPTTTGAAKALTKIFPDLSLRIGGAGIRVPVPDGSLTDITCIVRRSSNTSEVNSIFREASEGRFKQIMEYTEEPIVSADILGNPHSCVFDAGLTSVIGKMVKVVGWYDNEIGYSNRLVDLIRRIA